MKDFFFVRYYHGGALLTRRRTSHINIFLNPKLTSGHATLRVLRPCHAVSGNKPGSSRPAECVRSLERAINHGLPYFIEGPALARWKWYWILALNE